MYAMPVALSAFTTAATTSSSVTGLLQLPALRKTISKNSLYLLRRSLRMLRANTRPHGLASCAEKTRTSTEFLLDGCTAGAPHFFSINIVDEFFRRFHKCIIAESLIT